MTCAVLTFHDIGDSGSILSYPTSAFRQLLESLARSTVPVLPLDDLLRRREGIALTFDDGLASLAEQALPVLRDFGFAAHVFLTTGAATDAGSPSHRTSVSSDFRMLSWSQVDECAKHGVRIEAHTMTHPDLRTLAAPAIVDECMNANRIIESRVGRHPEYFAYPFGRFDGHVVEAVRPLYRASFTTRLRMIAGDSDSARLPRIDTYYLQPRWLQSNPLSLTTRTYLAARDLIRQIRGST